MASSWPFRAWKMLHPSIAALVRRGHFAIDDDDGCRRFWYVIAPSRHHRRIGRLPEIGCNLKHLKRYSAKKKKKMQIVMLHSLSCVLGNYFPESSNGKHFSLSYFHGIVVCLFVCRSVHLVFPDACYLCQRLRSMATSVNLRVHCFLQYITIIMMIHCPMVCIYLFTFLLPYCFRFPTIGSAGDITLLPRPTRHQQF